MRYLAPVGAIALACLVAAGPALGRPARAPRASFVELVRAAARRHAVPEPLAYAVAFTESHFDPRARSRAGAVGLMQVMPGTARDAGRRGPLVAPAANAECGMRILAVLLRDAGGDWGRAAAHYNAGRHARSSAGAGYARLILARARGRRA